MWIDVAKLYPLYEKTNQSFQSASWYDTDEAEARELKAGTEVNPVPQETLKKMRWPSDDESFAILSTSSWKFLSIYHNVFFFLSFIFFVILLLFFF